MASAGKQAAKPAARGARSHDGERRGIGSPPRHYAASVAGNLSMQSLRLARGSDTEFEAEAAAQDFLRGARPASGGGGAIPASRRMPGTGTSLPAPLRGEFEQHFGRDLGAVRLHEFPAELASSGANAFALGSDIALAPGRYSPATAAGQRLLAHEVAHVVQQAGGGGVLSSVDESIQADGSFSDSDLEKIREWLGQYDGFPPLSELDPDAMRAFYPQGPLFPGGAKTLDAAFEDFDPRLPYGRVPDSEPICPNCHQSRQQLWDAKQRRLQAEAREKRLQDERNELAAREAAWAGLHKSQHPVELARQPATLADAVEVSSLTAAEARLKLFDHVLNTGKAPFSKSGGLTSSRLTAGLRDAWVDAQRASIVLRALLRSAPGPIPDDLVAPFKDAFASFYSRLMAGMRELDAEAWRLALQFEELEAELGPAMRRARNCPSGACHSPAPKRVQDANSTLAPTAFQAFPTPKAKPVYPVAQVGPGQRRLQDAIAMLCTSDIDWAKQEAEFQWAVGRMDELLTTEVLGVTGLEDTVKTLKYARELEENQRNFEKQYPDGVKVRAIYYPKYDVSKHRNEEGREEYSAKGIPWELYLTSKPAASGKVADVGHVWELHDITASNKARGRSVSARHQVSMIEALARERFQEFDAPHTMFKDLNHKDFFPEGILYYWLPGQEQPRHVVMDEPWTFGDWLTYVGMGIAILGSLVFTAGSTTGLVVAAIGTGLTITGRVVRYEEMRENGVLRGGEEGRLFLDIALDVLSMITLGAGRVVQAAHAAGNLARFAQARQVWFALRSTQLAGDVLQVGIMAHDLVKQYEAIMSSNMSNAEKERALKSLTSMALFSGAMSFLPVYGGVRELRQMSKLSVIPHPISRNPVATVADAADESGDAARRYLGQKPFFKSLPFTDEEGARHTHSLMPDGTIRRCSPPPCKELSESVVQRVANLARSLAPDSPNASEVRNLLWSAQLVRNAAKDAARRGEKALQEEGEALLKKARELESKFIDLKKAIESEGEELQRVGRDAAQARFGPEALDYRPDHYYWQRNRDGTLTFRRSRSDVPRMEFVPGDPAKGTKGHFKKTSSFFVPESAQRVRELDSASEAAGRTVFREVDNIDDLNKLLPYYSPNQQKGFVLVRVTDENFHQFSSQPLKPGEMRVYPDGNRHWRNQDGTIGTENPVRLGIPRQHHETTTPPQLSGKGGRSNEGVPIEGGTQQRAHPAGGAGAGFDVPIHIYFAPEEINQLLQNKGIELFIRTLKKNHPNTEFIVGSRYSAIKDTRRQAWIEYTLHIEENGVRRKLLELRITTNQYRKYKADLKMLFVTGRKDDLKLLFGVDMKEAVKQLDENIRKAMQRRKAP